MGSHRMHNQWMYQDFALSLVWWRLVVAQTYCLVFNSADLIYVVLLTVIKCYRIQKRLLHLHKVNYNFLVGHQPWNVIKNVMLLQVLHRIRIELIKLIIKDRRCCLLTICRFIFCSYHVVLLVIFQSGIFICLELFSECHEIWERKPPGTLWATPGLLRDSFTFT
jgi:hypothetical protein